MTTFDLSPLLRSSVGFDAFDNIFDSVFNLNESSGAYPPYNIVKSVNNYTIYFKHLDNKLIKSYLDADDVLRCAASIRIEGAAINLVKSTKIKIS